MAEMGEMQNISPPSPRLKKLFLICAGVGLGLGVGIVATVALVVSFNHRPIPPRDWPRLEVEGAGLQAKLKTDWDRSVRYQLVVTPRSDDLRSAFDSAVRTHEDSITFTILLYNKAGFQLCKKEVRPSTSVDAANHIDSLLAKDSLYSFECTRSAYLEADHWSLSYVFPALVFDKPSASETHRHIEPRETAPVMKISSGKPFEGYDILTGFDIISGHLEMLSGKTFVVYREGEQGTASMWNAQGETGSQPSIHFSCDWLNECVLRNTTNDQAIHAKLQR